MSKILLVDDDTQALESTRKILELHGHYVQCASDGQGALEKVRSQNEGPFDLVVTDVRMPRLGGLDFLKTLRVCGNKTPVILMTAYGTVEDAVDAMKLGAIDFLKKPFKKQTLLSAVDSILTPAYVGGSSALVGRSQAIHDLKEMIQKVAETHVSVLILGESGTGKELIARSIHEMSSRRKHRLITVNCAAIPESLIEAELFGFEKGAFTGASHSKEGLFEAAHLGTLFLDEMGDMPLSLQAKLLRVLQDKEVRRIGATTSKTVDVRVISATHQDLKSAVEQGKFRSDLLYRLDVVTLSSPPLRERKEDLPDLVSLFLKQASERHNKELIRIHPKVMEILERHPWPGNVRELSNVIERAVVFATDKEMKVEDLPAHLLNDESRGFHPISVPVGTSLKDVQELLIRKTLEATDGDKTLTARLLGINSRTIYRRLDKTKGE